MVCSLVSLFVSARAQAQDSTCEYARCALSIAPRLTSLDVVRGEAETRVASLPFLWPGDVTRIFVTDSVALSLAQRAVRHRRLAALMTDVGIVAAVVGASQLHSETDRSRGTALVSGGAMLIVASVPIHFSADADLSRAVWRFNRRFSR